MNAEESGVANTQLCKKHQIYERHKTALFVISLDAHLLSLPVNTLIKNKKREAEGIPCMIQFRKCYCILLLNIQKSISFL